MTKYNPSLRRNALGIVFGAAMALIGCGSQASAQIAPLSASFEKPEPRAVSHRRQRHANISRSAARKANRHARSGKSRGRHIASARGGSGNKGALMSTLARVKPAGLPLKLAAAVVTMESGWRVNARGSSGEIGLMQLMPATARQYGAGNLYNPTENMRVGTRVLHDCYRRAGGNVSATIGCYNRGPGLMWSWGGRSITRRYVSKVHNYMARG